MSFNTAPGEEIDDSAKRNLRQNMLHQKSMTALKPQNADFQKRKSMLEGIAKHQSTSSLLSPLAALKRSNSHNALFNELVLQVPINNTDREFSDSSADSEASTIASIEHEVSVYDALLETPISVTVRESTTFNELKIQIQAAQGRAGLRIIPSHVQVISIAGKSTLSDDAFVMNVLNDRDGNDGCGPSLVVEPMVAESISFFLASVNNLSATGPSSPSTTAASLSPESSPAPHHKTGVAANREKDEGDCTSWADDFFSLGEMEGHETAPTESIEPYHAAPSRSSDSSPCSAVAKSPLESKMSVLRLADSSKPVLVPRPGRLVSWGQELAPLEIEQPSDSALSARVTPSAAGSESPQIYGTSYEGASVLESLFAQRDGTCCDKTAGEKRGVLFPTLLRAVGDAGDAYATQSHLVMRNRGECLPLVERLKLPALEKLVLEVQSGLRHGHTPEELEDSSSAKMDYGELLNGCCGGTYLMRNSKGKPTAIFKPMDEEPYAPANPKGYTGSMDVESDMRSGIPVGGGAARECAAYLIDHEGFTNIPSTTMLRISHSTLQNGADAEVELKVGSLQRFCEHECTVEDVGTSSFPVDLVHAIGVFDVRVFNMDRNSDNILYAPAKGGEAPRLVPIDHGYILPSVKHLEEVEACWLHWPQAKQPFSERTRSYIDALRPEEDMDLLRSALALSEESLLTLWLGTTLLQKGASAGLTLHDIGNLMLRDHPDEPSPVERVVAECTASAPGAAELRALMEEKLGCLVQRRKVGHNFERMGLGMHRRSNSQVALLMTPESDSSDEA